MRGVKRNRRLRKKRRRRGKSKGWLGFSQSLEWKYEQRQGTRIKLSPNVCEQSLIIFVSSTSISTNIKRAVLSCVPLIWQIVRAGRIYITPSGGVQCVCFSRKLEPVLGITLIYQRVCKCFMTYIYLKAISEPNWKFYMLPWINFKSSVSPVLSGYMITISYSVSFY